MTKFFQTIFQILFVILSFSNFLEIKAQISFEKTLGGSMYDKGYTVRQTSEGGYIIAGETKSYGYGESDVYLLKTDMFGNEVWHKTYGTADEEGARSMSLLNDGGYIIAGYTKNTLTYKKDIYLIRTDSNGDTLWTKIIGRANRSEEAYSIYPTSDGGFIVGGTFHYVQVVEEDIYLVKIDSIGTVEWERFLGFDFSGNWNDTPVPTSVDSPITSFNSLGYEYGFMVKETNDLGFIAVGYCEKCSDDINRTNGVIIKIDNNKSIQWTKIITGNSEPSDDISFAVDQTHDNGYIISSAMDNGISSLLKLDANGNQIWEKFYNYTGYQTWFSIENYIQYAFELADSGFIIVGHIQNPSGNDMHIIKTNSSGELQWEKSFGGLNADGGYFGGTTNDNGFVFTGTHSYTDVFLVKTNEMNLTKISGNVFYDYLQDCNKDTSEIYLKGVILKLSPDNEYRYSGDTGQYAFYVDTGLFSIEILPDSLWKNDCPDSTGLYNIYIDSTRTDTNNILIGQQASVYCHMIDLDIAMSFLRICDKNSIYINYCNNGTKNADSVTIELAFDSSLFLISSNTPYTQIGLNTYLFNIGTVDINTCGQIIIVDSVSCSTNIGNIACVQVITSTSDSSCISHDTISECQWIIGSYDPNIKQVKNSINEGYDTDIEILPNDTLTYIIHFQNTGNDTAFIVNIIDTISPFLDISSVRPISSSHISDFNFIYPNIIKWTFLNINLPDSNTNEVESHGYVKFSVKQKQNNSNGTVIKNSASIYFDYNSPIITNSTICTINIPIGIDEKNQTFNKNGTITAYPNPTKNTITFLIPDMYSNYENLDFTLVDIYGKNIIKSLERNSNEIILSTSELSKGLYIYKFSYADIVINTGKIIVQ